MSSKTITITYWVLTILLVALSLFDAVGGLTHEVHGVQGVTHLGYPVYLLDINGVAKIIGALCLIQTKYKTIKEWAYAGYFISFICAAWSHAAVGDAVPQIIMPVVIMGIFLLSYYFWKKYLQVKAAK
jgi:NADH:ubiquinone oxidoreductase subunit 5 (subunit L)/multisubunit Na+/H+ antiporter MnhA subunit